MPAALSFCLPRTVPVPEGNVSSPWMARRTEFTGLHGPLLVPPRQHDELARWKARQRLQSLPWIRDEDELDRWLATASVKPGEVAAYHRGILAADRLRSRRLDLLARAVILRASTLLYRMSTCGHARGMWQGSGDLVPFARRLRPGLFLYCMARTKPPLRSW